METTNKKFSDKNAVYYVTYADLIIYDGPQWERYSLIRSDLICSEQNRQYKHDTLMDAWQILQISRIKPTGSSNPSTKLCFYRRVSWLELTMHGDVSASKEPRVTSFGKHLLFVSVKYHTPLQVHKNVG